MKKNYPTQPPLNIDENKTYTATMKTNHGDIGIQLLPKNAPLTVNNFVFLARDGYYEGVKFHRIVKGFMIQGGDPTGTGAGGPGYKFRDELPTMLDYNKGILAMANAGPNTNGSQFFITTAPTTWLNGHHTIFGQVTKGYEFVPKIENTPGSIRVLSSLLDHRYAPCLRMSEGSVPAE